MKEAYTPPTQLHFFDSTGKFHFIPFVYKREQVLNADMTSTWTDNLKVRYPVIFLSGGGPTNCLA